MYTAYTGVYCPNSNELSQPTPRKACHHLHGSMQEQGGYFLPPAQTRCHSAPLHISVIASHDPAGDICSAKKHAAKALSNVKSQYHVRISLSKSLRIAQVISLLLFRKVSLPLQETEIHKQKKRKTNANLLNSDNI